MDFYELIGKPLDEAVKLLPADYFLVSGVAFDCGGSCTYGSHHSDREISLEYSPVGIVASVGLSFAPSV